MITTRDIDIVHAYFYDQLGLHWSIDLRGVLYVPDELAGVEARPEHVAIGVAYNAFIGRTCCMHSVITRPETVTRAIVRETFHYPFITCGCEAVLALVDSTNSAAMKFDTKLGFRHIATIPNGGSEGDLNVLQMLRGECRWIKQSMH